MNLRIFLLFLGVGTFGYASAYPNSYYYGNYPKKRSPSSSTYNSLDSRYGRNRESTASRSDKENAKFAGASNQELDEVGDERTLLLKKKLKRLYRPYAAAAFGGYGGYGGFGGGYGGNPCSPFGRDVQGSGSGKGLKDPKEQGRFLFDVNVYNVYGGGCRGFGGIGGGGGGGGLFSDPIGPPVAPLPVPVRPYAPFSTWLSLFAPGLYQSAISPSVVPLADPIRPPPPSAAGDLQSDPAVDPNYPVRRPVPNRVYYDSAGAPPVTPGQLVGGISTTVNGIIQQLTGQVQPVYQSGAYRARTRSQRSSYG